MRLDDNVSWSNGCLLPSKLIVQALYKDFICALCQRFEVEHAPTLTNKLFHFHITIYIILDLNSCPNMAVGKWESLESAASFSRWKSAIWVETIQPGYQQTEYHKIFNSKWFERVQQRSSRLETIYHWHVSVSRMCRTLTAFYKHYTVTTLCQDVLRQRHISFMR